MRRIVLTCLLCMVIAPLFAQQDAQSGQYVYNGLYINPAYAGYREAVYMQAFYRSQWTGLKGAPQNLSLSIDAPIPSKNIGIGAVINKDKIGAQSMLNGYVNFAYHLQLNYKHTNTLAFGLGAGVLQSGINGDQLNAIDEGDTRIPVGFESKVVPDLRMGVQLSTERFFIGFSANNVFSNRIADVNNVAVSLYAQTHYYFTAAMNFPIKDDMVFKPAFLIKDDLHGPASLDLNTFLVLKDRISLGAMYRTSLRVFPRENLQEGLTKRSAVGIISDFLIQKRFRIGYGFEYSLNKLSSHGNGSHEISFGYYFTIPPEKSKLFFCF